MFVLCQQGLPSEYDITSPQDKEYLQTYIKVALGMGHTIVIGRLIDPPEGTIGVEPWLSPGPFI